MARRCAYCLAMPAQYAYDADGPAVPVCSSTCASMICMRHGRRREATRFIGDQIEDASPEQLRAWLRDGLREFEKAREAISQQFKVGAAEERKRLTAEMAEAERQWRSALEKARADADRQMSSCRDRTNELSAEIDRLKFQRQSVAIQYERMLSDLDAQRRYAEEHASAMEQKLARDVDGLARDRLRGLELRLEQERGRTAEAADVAKRATEEAARGASSERAAIEQLELAKQRSAEVDLRLKQLEGQLAEERKRADAAERRREALLGDHEELRKALREATEAVSAERGRAKEAVDRAAERELMALEAEQEARQAAESAKHTEQESLAKRVELVEDRDREARKNLMLSKANEEFRRARDSERARADDERKRREAIEQQMAQSIQREVRAIQQLQAELDSCRRDCVKRGPQAEEEVARYRRLADSEHDRAGALQNEVEELRRRLADIEPGAVGEKVADLKRRLAQVTEKARSAEAKWTAAADELKQMQSSSANGKSIDDAAKLLKAAASAIEAVWQNPASLDCRALRALNSESRELAARLPRSSQVRRIIVSMSESLDRIEAAKCAEKT